MSLAFAFTSLCRTKACTHAGMIVQPNPSPRQHTVSRKLLNPRIGNSQHRGDRGYLDCVHIEPPNLVLHLDRLCGRAVPSQVVHLVGPVTRTIPNLCTTYGVATAAQIYLGYLVDHVLESVAVSKRKPTGIAGVRRLGKRRRGMPQNPERASADDQISVILGRTSIWEQIEPKTASCGAVSVAAIGTVRLRKGVTAVVREVVTPQDNAPRGRPLLDSGRADGATIPLVLSRRRDASDRATR